jgi:hypothetical protein
MYRFVKQIFRYLKGTLDFGLWYPKGEDFTLTTYTDADWEGNVDDRKSTSGGEFFLGNCLVSWLKQETIFNLIVHNRSRVHCSNILLHTILWMKQTLQDIQVEYKKPIYILCDNTSAISISKNPVMHSKTKHIPIKYHFLREQVNNKVCQVGICFYQGTNSRHIYKTPT